MVAATRQNAGRFVYATSPGWRFSEKEAGGAKVPGVTEVAIVIAVCGSESLKRSSQVVAAIAQVVAYTKADAVRKVCWELGRLVILLLQSVYVLPERTKRSLTQM
ncbi:MAG TPA: hypothetical protein VGR73_09220 [Bryobacteraceae bacterium]|nr:hypothetical protein [Bryobacteraceae bacterium]